MESQEKEGIQQHNPFGGTLLCRYQGTRESSLAPTTTDRHKREEARAQVSGNLI